jgi:hypothetical protein
MSRNVAYEDIAAELARRIDRTVWCSMATVDRERRVRSRIVHPLWDGRVGWLLTERHSPKARDVDGNPWLSLTYIDSAQEQVHVDCRTEWESRPAEKRRLWDWFKSDAVAPRLRPRPLLPEGCRGRVVRLPPPRALADRALVARRADGGEAAAGVEGEAVAGRGFGRLPIVPCERPTATEPE